MESGNKLDRRKDVAEYFVEHNLIGLEGYKDALRAHDYNKQGIRELAAKKFASEETVRLISEARGRREYSQEKAVKLLEELKQDCKDNNDRTNLLGAIKELDRIHRLYGEEGGGITINQVIVSPQERKKTLMKELELLNQIENAPLAIAE